MEFDFAKLDQRLVNIESTMVTRDEFTATLAASEGRVNTRMDGMTNRMDEMITILNRLDHERIFTVEWVRRIESDVDRVKKKLHLI